jgi:hypothetical protein
MNHWMMKKTPSVTFPVNLPRCSENIFSGD